MPIKKILRGQIYAQQNDGVLVPYMALTKQALVTLEGQSLANQVFLASGHANINIKDAFVPLVRITGVVSGCTLSGDGTTNNVEVAAGVANVNGSQIAVTGTTTHTVTRGAAGKYAVTAVSVNASGTITLTKGVDGDSLDLTGGYGGVGQKPLVPITDCCLGYISTYDSTAAIIPNANIYAGDNANLAYRVDPLRGGIILGAVLEVNQVGSLPRTIYMQFYDISASLLPIGNLEEATLTVKQTAPTAVPTMDTVWDQYISTGERGWTVAVKKWRQDQFFVDKVLDPTQDLFFLKLVEDSTDAYAYYGYALSTGGMSLLIKRGAVPEPLSFTGTGELRRA